MKVEFSTRLAISDACSMTKDNWYILAVFYLVYVAVSGIPTIGTIISMFLAVGMTKLYLNVVAGEQPSFDAFKLPLSTYCNYIVAMIIFVIVVVLATFLLIIPGIYVAVRLSFLPQLVVDRELGFVDAIKTSWELTKDNVWHLFLAHLLIALFTMLGFLCLGIGILYTGPVAGVASILVYRHFVPAQSNGEWKIEN